MPLHTCNIDARGRAIRLLSGLVVALVGLGLLLALFGEHLQAGYWWWLAGAAVVGGLFQIYEGWQGWCVLRAMGMKTPV